MEYMPGRGASGGLAGAQIHKEKLNPETSLGAAFTAVGSRLIVDE